MHGFLPSAVYQGGTVGDKDQNKKPLFISVFISHTSPPLQIPKKMDRNCHLCENRSHTGIPMIGNGGNLQGGLCLTRGEKTKGVTFVNTNLGSQYPPRKSPF